jgi:PAS domain S-box-containing protein
MRIPFRNKQVLPSPLEGEMQIIKERTEEATLFVREIEKGNLQIGTSDRLRESELGESLLSMQKHLVKIAEEERERNWINVGLARFSDILRNKESLDLKCLANEILSSLVKYVRANQGALFLLESEVKGDEYLEMIACYAYERKKYLNMRIGLGEGLAGQCVLEGELIYLTEIPSHYVSITSGLGQATPKCVLISPLSINERIFGVMELASLDTFKHYEIDFVKKLSESIAATIKNVKDSERTQALLSASQQQAEELRSQEEEMRQNMEEMLATQEEIGRKNTEIHQLLAESKGKEEIIQQHLEQVKSIQEETERTLQERTFDLKVREDVFGITSILSESDLKGNIIYANRKLSEVSKYSVEEMVGRPHNIFRHPDMPKELFRLFWETLKKGEVFRGVVKNRAKDGSHYWVDGCFVPVKNEMGQVVKYVGARYHISDNEMAKKMYNEQALRLGLPLLD